MLINHPVVGKAKSKMLGEAFIAGAPKDARGHVFWGVNETNAAAWEAAKRSGEDWYYGDNSYFDCVRGKQFRWTKNRVQVRPVCHTSDGKRFDALGLTLAPRKNTPHGHWLLIEQSPSFMATVARGPGWFADTHHRLNCSPHARMVVRKWNPDKDKQGATLAADLVGCRMLVTHCSAAAVTATLAGIPVCVAPMSPLWGSSDYPGAMLHAMRVMSDGQFSIEQMQTGEAYEWVSK